MSVHNKKKMSNNKILLILFLILIIITAIIMIYYKLKLKPIYIPCINEESDVLKSYYY